MPWTLRAHRVGRVLRLHFVQDARQRHAVARLIDAAAGAAAGPGPRPEPVPGPMPVPLPVPAPPPVPDPCDGVGGPAALRSRPGASPAAAASLFAGMFSCSTGSGSFFDLLRLELRRLLDRNGDLVLARQLRLARRLLHLVAAATTAAARTGLAQPDDVAVRLLGQHRGLVVVLAL